MKKRVMATIVVAVLVLAGCNDKQKSAFESISSEETDVLQNDSTTSLSAQGSDVSIETQKSENAVPTNVSTAVTTAPREYTKAITMRYGSDSEIVFDWNKSDEGSQTLYHSLKNEIDSSAIAILSRETTGNHVVTCSPEEDNAETLKYECDDQSTMTLYKNKINYILLQGKETSQIGVVEILGTENKAKG